MVRPSIHRRVAITLMETTVALVVIAVLAVVVAQCIVSSQRERARLAAQQAALELAANVLEAARGQPWEKLDKTWAEAQTVPLEMTALLPEGKVVVTLQAEPQTAHARRVTVEVSWQTQADLPPRSVLLTGVFTARQAKKTEAK